MSSLEIENVLATYYMIDFKDTVVERYDVVHVQWAGSNEEWRVKKYADPDGVTDSTLHRRIKSFETAADAMRYALEQSGWTDVYQ